MSAHRVVASARSHWIRAIYYSPLAPADRAAVEGWPPPAGFLIIESQTGRRYAYLVPAWVPGLFVAADRAGRSLGRLHNRIVRGRFPSVAVPKEIKL